MQALNYLKLEIPEMQPHEFESKLVLYFGFEPDAVDIINYTPGIEFDEVFRNSHEVEFDGLKVKMIDIRDLLKNKQALKREGEKSYLDKFDAEVLKRIIENRK